eukprot:TRINITY_DN85_c1_g1_i5.p2 TRINITY_DN85_c1_g1~~TRINITY_DN85_c1_g1_i5.p2  ORF type:complete len:582 (+),score=219.35 TRINITY_DN85_c1_g1_i5:66-1748(+)
MRMLCLAALAAVSSATLLHKATTVPEGWRATSEAVDPAMKFDNVVIGMRRSNTAVLKQLVAAVSDPSGSQYLQYPTYEEVGELVRPAAEHTAAVRKWLAGHGVHTVVEHPHGDHMRIEATAAQLEAMSGGRFTTYQHVAGMKIVRATGGVDVPAEVAAAVETFSGFNGFPLRPVMGSGAEQVRRHKKTAGLKAGGKVTPPFLRTTYNVSAVPSSGKTNIQAIAQFQGQYVRDLDLQHFCEKYDPSSAPCKIDKYLGKDSQAMPGVESMLDTEYIVPIGGVPTWVYSYPSTDFCNDLIEFAGNVTSESEHPWVISISYGSQKIDFCDTSLISRFASDVEKMAALGITVLISSGDDGSGHSTRQGINAGKLSPSYPASVPHALAVGATWFVSGTTGAEEATTQFGSGGGFSYDFDAPSYQTSQIATYLSTVELPKTYAYAKTGRGSPDVSALGEAFTVRVSGSDYAVGGTSASSPSFAGFVTILNEVCLSVGGKTLGFANPFFYANPQAFRDVTAGTNAIGGNTEGWKAIKGWDASTGLGTPNVAALITAVRASCAKAARRN